MNRTPTLLAGLTAGALVIAACSGGDDDSAATTAATSTTVVETSTTVAETTTTSTTEATTTTTTAPGEVIRMPLTGEPIDDLSDVPDRPALVVKISNAPSSVVPQAGLNQADLVIEEIINDRATRLAAVFHTTESDPVGPVRSGRAQDINLLLALNRPLFAWSGGNPSVTRAIENSELIELSALHSPGYYRRSGRSSPNNLYSSTDALWGQAPDDAEVPPQVFEYLLPGAEVPGEDAERIEIVLDDIDARWQYDEDSGRYFRFQDGAEHNTESAEASSGAEQVWVDNVVVMLADYGVNPADGNPDAQVLGSNPVYVFTGGKVQTGTWLRFEPTDPFGFFDDVEALNPLGLQAGRTWLEIPRNRDDVLSWS